MFYADFTKTKSVWNCKYLARDVWYFWVINNNMGAIFMLKTFANFSTISCQLCKKSNSELVYSLILGPSRKVFLSFHDGCYWKFLIKRYLRQISVLGTNEYKIWKHKGTFIVLKAYTYTNGAFLLFLMPKLEICFKYFLDKNPRKQQ